MAKALPAGSFQITDGPPKFDLMCSLFDGKTVKISCELTPQSGPVKIYPKIEVIFFSVGIEDGSRESWIGTVTFTDTNYETETRNFYYSSKNRKGVIRERV